MGFSPTKAEPDIWIRRNGDHYEYVATYVDDLVIVSRDPQAIVDSITKEHGLKVKGTGNIDYHLGCDYFRDEDGVRCLAPKKYIEKMISQYERLFGDKPRQYNSPLEKGDHPELDLTDELDIEGIKIYQSMIGALQWVIQIGRFDIATAVMTMSSFRANPRKGHLDRLKRIYGYLLKMKNGIIRFRTSEPDYSGLAVPEYDWERTAYAGAQELLPKDAPEPLGNPVTTTTYFDANLYHDMLSGRSVTGILHFLNKTPVEWYTKKQSSNATATYTSEFHAGRTATEQVIDFRLTLRYLGVPIKDSYLFGDNKSMIDSSTLPQSRLHKRHVMLSYHQVREAVAAKIVKLCHVAGEHNPADILSKHWGYQQIWPLLQPILFWQGDTRNIVRGVTHADQPVGE